jgi:hypothetical protein
MKKPTAKKVYRAPLEKQQAGKYLKHGKFELLDVDLIKSLQPEFTTCIVDLPFWEIYRRELTIYKQIAEQIYPLLLDSASILVKASSTTCSLAEQAFTQSDFRLEEMLIQVSGDFHTPWLLFQREDTPKSPGPVKTVFSSLKPSKQELNFYEQIAPDDRPTNQSFLNEIIKQLCPKPRKSKVLVPYGQFGSAIAACQRLGIKSVGYDSTEIDEDSFKSLRDIIVTISQFK